MINVAVSCELVVDAKAEIGESAVWDHRTGELYWVDIFKGQLFRWLPKSGISLIAEIDQPLGFVVPSDSGGWIAGLRDGFARIDKSGTFEFISSITDGAGYRLNDGKADRWGRVWAGTVCDSNPVNGSLYRLERDGSLIHIRSDLRFPNGIAWSPDAAAMYVADSLAQKVEVWTCTSVGSHEFDQLSDVIAIPSELGRPDGMTVDSQGGVWVAMFGGGSVLRFTPDGKLDLKIELPVANVTTVTFGGEDFADLYITTARYALTGAELLANPRAAGAIFRCRPGVKGLPVDLGR